MMLVDEDGAGITEAEAFQEEKTEDHNTAAAAAAAGGGAAGGGAGEGGAGGGGRLYEYYVRFEGCPRLTAKAMLTGALREGEAIRYVQDSLTRASILCLLPSIEGRQ